jgi:hypothetical protein
MLVVRLEVLGPPPNRQARYIENMKINWYLISLILIPGQKFRSLQQTAYPQWTLQWTSTQLLGKS